MRPPPDHWARLERMYLGAPTNQYYRPTIRIGDGEAEIAIEARPEFFHAATGVHGSVYFKLLDDAGFFAASSLVGDVMLLTSDYAVHLLRPISEGLMTCRGKVLSPGGRQFLAEANLFDGAGQRIAHGVGTYVKSKIPLTPQIGYV